MTDSTTNVETPFGPASGEPAPAVTPASEPEATPTTPDVVQDEGGSEDFSSSDMDDLLANEFDDVESNDQQAAEETPAEPATEQAPPPESEPPAPVAEPPAPVPEAPTEPVAEVPALDQQQQVDTTVEGLSEALAQYRAQAIDVLAAQVYNLPEDVAQQLDENPAQVLPRLAAQVHIEAQLAAVNQVARLLPAMMRAVQTQQTQAQGFEGQFFERFPDLKDNYAEVLKAAQFYRTANPQASAEEVIENAGTHAMLMLKKPIVQQTVGQVVQQTPPFNPVASTAAAHVPKPVHPPVNEFEQMAAEELLEDAG